MKQPLMVAQVCNVKSFVSYNPFSFVYHLTLFSDDLIRYCSRISVTATEETFK